MKVSQIELSWFRGASSNAVLKVKGKSVVVFGENACGKSSFIDAVEYIISKGKVAHLQHEYSGTQQCNSIKNTESISATCDSMSAISETQFFPLLKTIHIAPTRTQLNEIVKCIIQIYKNYASLLNEFESLANKCKQVSLNTGFMGELANYDTELFDFVNRLAETSTKNRIEFNDGFYGFIQLYGNEPFSKIKKSEMAQIAKETEHLIGLVKNVIKPSLTRESIDRENRRVHQRLQGANQGIEGV